MSTAACLQMSERQRCAWMLMGSAVSFSCMILHLLRPVVVIPFVMRRVGALRCRGGVALLSSSCTELHVGLLNTAPGLRKPERDTVDGWIRMWRGPSCTHIRFPFLVQLCHIITLDVSWVGWNGLHGSRMDGYPPSSFERGFFLSICL